MVFTKAPGELRSLRGLFMGLVAFVVAVNPIAAVMTNDTRYDSHNIVCQGLLLPVARVERQLFSLYPYNDYYLFLLSYLAVQYVVASPLLFTGNVYNQDGHFLSCNY